DAQQAARGGEELVGPVRTRSACRARKTRSEGGLHGEAEGACWACQDAERYVASINRTAELENENAMLRLEVTESKGMVEAARTEAAGAMRRLLDNEEQATEAIAKATQMQIGVVEVSYAAGEDSGQCSSFPILRHTICQAPRFFAHYCRACVSAPPHHLPSATLLRPLLPSLCKCSATPSAKRHASSPITAESVRKELNGGMSHPEIKNETATDQWSQAEERCAELRRMLG
ncbi:hypothetical protein CYMTET_10006, partial [Cymbomonas tetramitiformis]